MPDNPKWPYKKIDKKAEERKEILLESLKWFFDSDKKATGIEHYAWMMGIGWKEAKKEMDKIIERMK